MKRVASRKFSAFVTLLLFLATILLCGLLYFLRLETKTSLPIAISAELIFYIIAVGVITRKLIQELLFQGLIVIVFFRILLSIFVGVVFWGMRKNELTFLLAYLDALILYLPSQIIQAIISPILAYPIITHFEAPQKKPTKEAEKEREVPKTFIQIKRPRITEKEIKISPGPKTETKIKEPPQTPKAKNLVEEPIINIPEKVATPMATHEETLPQEVIPPYKEEALQAEVVSPAIEIKPLEEKAGGSPSAEAGKIPEYRGKEEIQGEVKEKKEVVVPPIETIRVSIRSIIKKNEGKQGSAVLEKLVKKGIDFRLEIPFSIIEPQLERGEIQVPVYEVYEMLPIEFINFVPGEQIGDLTKINVELPLGEVVQQIPPEYFIAKLPQKEIEFAPSEKEEAELLLKKNEIVFAEKPAVEEKEEVEKRAYPPPEPKIDVELPEIESAPELSITPSEQEQNLLIFQEETTEPRLEEIKSSTEPELILDTTSTEETRLIFDSFEFSKYETKEKEELFAETEESEEELLFEEPEGETKIEPILENKLEEQLELERTAKEEEVKEERLSPQPLLLKLKPQIFTAAYGKVYTIISTEEFSGEAVAKLFDAAMPIFDEISLKKVSGKYKNGVIEGRYFELENKLKGLVLVLAPDEIKLEVIRFDFQKVINDIIKNATSGARLGKLLETSEKIPLEKIEKTDTELEFNGRVRLYISIVEGTRINYFLPYNILPKEPFNYIPYLASSLQKILSASFGEILELTISSSDRHFLIIYEKETITIFFTISNKKPGLLLLAAKQIAKARLKA